ncbi:hypothetical protein [Haloarcula sp. H-GB5]|jgi:hypothetical protein
MTSDSQPTDDEHGTISIDGLGEITSPSALREQNRSKYETKHVPVPDKCPVLGCSASGYSNFKELRAHFGNAADAAHRAYNLSIDDYRNTEK